VTGRSGIGSITLFDASDLKAELPEVKNFGRTMTSSGTEPKRMARHTQFAYAAT